MAATVSHKIPAISLVREAQVMWNEDWEYVWGGSSRDKIDCSGVLVYVYRKHGLKIYHGSNRIARKHVEKLIPTDEAIREGLIVPGMVAFRSHEPGERGYDISAQYKPDGSQYTGDLRDYYHIGVIDEDVAYVLNAAGTTNDFERHPLAENWSHVARLTDVDYDTQYKDKEPLIDVHETIRKGAKGTAVARLQGLLRQRGYDIEADGKFGAKTESALKAFQASVQLVADGICGPKSWAALQDELPDVEMEPEPESPAPALPTLEDMVRELWAWMQAQKGGGSDGS